MVSIQHLRIRLYDGKIPTTGSWQHSTRTYGDEVLSDVTEIWELQQTILFFLEREWHSSTNVVIKQNKWNTEKSQC